jgi:transcriptional regulator with PAS, ATPase and Fis domain
MLLVNQVARRKNTVLLSGETGVGKEVIANAIHHSSTRCNGPFIKVNCGAIPQALIDSELFGHEKGAFTGAVSQKRGLFERAHMGTIFLDEIGELPLQAQIRLLRVLQTHVIERVGGTTSIPLDIRIIAATHQDLGNMVKEGRFREDLFFRINVFPIRIPPLRQRKEDIPAFIQHFLELKAKEFGIKPQSIISYIDTASLLDYDWPGNVRELGNVVERAMIQQRSGPILSSARTSYSGKVAMPVESNNPAKNNQSMDKIVSQHIRNVLKITNGKINGPYGASALLRVPPSTLRNKMNKLGILYGREYRRINRKDSNYRNVMMFEKTP